MSLNDWPGRNTEYGVQDGYAKLWLSLHTNASERLIHIPRVHIEKKENQNCTIVIAI